MPSDEDCNIFNKFHLSISTRIKCSKKLNKIDFKITKKNSLAIQQLQRALHYEFLTNRDLLNSQILYFFVSTLIILFFFTRKTLDGSRNKERTVNWCTLSDIIQFFCVVFLLLFRLALCPYGWVIKRIHAS